MSLRIVLVRASFRPSGRGLRLGSSSIYILHPAQSRPILKTVHEVARLTTRRFASTKPSAAATPKAKPSTPTTPSEARKYLYPETLVIYHAGTARTTFLACLKLATIFVFLFFNIIIVPSYLSSSQPPLLTAGIAACGVIPFVAVAGITSPFVASISIRLPPFARSSKDLLERWAKRGIEGNTEMYVTTLSVIGKPRVSAMRVGDLVAKRERFGLVNYVRDVQRENEARRWWMFRAVGRFNVTPGGEKRVKGGFIWPEVVKSIEGREAEKVRV